MHERKTLTFALLDAPFESARSVTALRLIEFAARRGYTVHVFAHEGAACLPSAAERDHVASLIDVAEKSGGMIDWVNCNLCTGDQDARKAIEGVRHGTPAEYWKLAAVSDSTLVIGTRT